MAKRTRRTSKTIEKKGDYDVDDHISWLPDEILVVILSSLTLKEAAVTSVLSNRWRNLWAFITRLDFDATETLVKVEMVPKLLKQERQKYVKWVNWVMGLHKGQTIEEFRVCFLLDKRSKCHIDKWLKFVLARRVYRLELSLSGDGGIPIHWPKCYTLSHELLGMDEKTSSGNMHSNISSMPHCSLVGFRSLQALCLTCVNVTGEVLEYFLSNCPVLERLSVSDTGDLVNLKVACSSLALKYLEICYCFNIKTVEICNLNLVSFTYLGPKANLLVENVPLLVEVYIGGAICISLDDVLFLLSRFLPQLENLTLDAHDDKDIEELYVPCELTKLKQLVVKMSAGDDNCLLGLTSLIKASPFLQKFVLEISLGSLPPFFRREVRKVVSSPHQNLKVVELSGYYGRTCDLEMAMYFIENAISLEKMIVDPRDQFVSPFPMEIEEIEEEDRARSRAKDQLEGKVPPPIEFLIL